MGCSAIAASLGVGVAGGGCVGGLPTSGAPFFLPFVTRLRRTMDALRPSPAAHHTKPTPFVFKDLATCSHAFLRDDTVRAPFRPPYSGPYLVVHRDDKNFILRINGNDVRVSIDRLKPAYIAHEESGDSRAATSVHPQPPTSQPAPATTRYGRRVRLPDFYKP